MMRISFARDAFTLEADEGIAGIPRHLEVELALLLGMPDGVASPRDWLVTFVGRDLEGADEFFHRVCDIQSEALFKEILLEDWGCSEDELMEMLSRPGAEPICCFGAGAQGIVFMLEDARFLKVTEDRKEAAFAALLLERPDDVFPRIDDVRRLIVGDREIFLVYRESVDDVFEPDEPASSQRAVTRAWNAAAYDEPPRPDALDLLSSADPVRHGLLSSLLLSLRDRIGRGLPEVSDLHVGNLGIGEDGRYVVRDFGFNTLSYEEVDDMLEGIAELSPWQPAPAV